MVFLDRQERSRGVIQASPERQKFFITIEEVKPTWSDKKHQTDYCFGKEAINSLKAIRRGHKGYQFNEFPDEFSYFQTCLARYVVKEPLINLRIMAHCGFDSRATVWTGS
jgi:hypothetical protein